MRHRYPIAVASLLRDLAIIFLPFAQRQRNYSRIKHESFGNSVCVNGGGG